MAKAEDKPTSDDADKPASFLEKNYGEFDLEHIGYDPCQFNLELAATLRKFAIRYRE